MLTRPPLLPACTWPVNGVTGRGETASKRFTDMAGSQNSNPVLFIINHNIPFLAQAVTARLRLTMAS